MKLEVILCQLFHYLQELLKSYLDELQFEFDKWRGFLIAISFSISGGQRFPYRLCPARLLT